MKKIALLVAVTFAAAGVSAANAKDSGFSSSFPGSAAKPADMSNMSPAAGTPSDTTTKPAKKKHHKKPATTTDTTTGTK